MYNDVLRYKSLLDNIEQGKLQNTQIDKIEERTELFVKKYEKIRKAWGNG